MHIKNQLVIAGYFLLIFSCLGVSFASENIHVAQLSKVMAFVFLLTTFKHLNENSATEDK